MENIEELAPPNTIHNATRAMEIARIWLVDCGQHVRLSGDLWDDPAAWGMMLVDLAKHVANAYEQNGKDKEEVLKRIVDGFNAEICSSTDDPSPLT